MQLGLKMPGDAYILWTEHGLTCRQARNRDGWQVSVEADGGTPLLRRFADSGGDAANQAEYLRLLLDRSRAGARKAADRQPLILIVTDDRDTLHAYDEILTMAGFRTALAATLVEGRRLIGGVKPAAILLDHVPDGDGPVFAMRNSPADAAIPIVLVTGLDTASVVPASPGGPAAILDKPCRPETLTGVLRLLVQRPPRKPTRSAPHVTAAPLVRARCPMCGTNGALLDAAGCFTCQQCGREGQIERTFYLDAQR